MRHTDVTRSSGPFATATNGAAHADTRVTGVGPRSFWSFLDAIFVVLERRKQRRALMALDDYLLKDIGVSRLDAEQEVAKPFWRG